MPTYLWYIWSDFLLFFMVLTLLLMLQKTMIIRQQCFVLNIVWRVCWSPFPVSIWQCPCAQSQVHVDLVLSDCSERADLSPVQHLWKELERRLRTGVITQHQCLTSLMMKFEMLLQQPINAQGCVINTHQSHVGCKVWDHVWFSIEVWQTAKSGCQITTHLTSARSLPEWSVWGPGGPGS